MLKRFLVFIRWNSFSFVIFVFVKLSLSLPLCLSLAVFTHGSFQFLSQLDFCEMRNAIYLLSFTSLLLQLQLLLQLLFAAVVACGDFWLTPYFSATFVWESSNPNNKNDDSNNTNIITNCNTNSNNKQQRLE